MEERKYTARFTPIPSGYMGQLVEWPEVLTEGKTVADCRDLLEDALKEMMLAYRELGKPLPDPADPAIYEPIIVNLFRSGAGT